MMWWIAWVAAGLIAGHAGVSTVYLKQAYPTKDICQLFIAQANHDYPNGPTRFVGGIEGSWQCVQGGKDGPE